ncbi:MAG: C40 family peptidase [Rudaea sp.]
MRLIREFVGCLIITLVVMQFAACSRNNERSQAPQYERGAQANPNDILFRAISLVGTPYRYGGNTPDGGFDCSGLVDYVFRTVAGIALPRTADEISHMRAQKVLRSQLESGDIVLFHTGGRGIGHVGIYVGKGRFVHAPNSGGTVRLDSLASPYWSEHYSGAMRVLK